MKIINKLFKTSNTNNEWLICLVFITMVTRTHAQSRCEYLCQKDYKCSKGMCVLTYCIDTPACFKYCFQCYDQEQCQQSGPYCDALTAADYFAYYLLKSNSGVHFVNFNLFALTLVFNFLIFF